jgi:hypothetical protein
MWDTTNLDLFPAFEKKHVKRCGIPHLAKNERDMGHPTLCGREKTGCTTATESRLCSVDRRTRGVFFFCSNEMERAVKLLISILFLGLLCISTAIHKGQGLTARKMDCGAR